MKIKKLAALALTCAMVVGGGAMFAACGDEKDPGGDTNGFVEDTRIWYAVGKDSKGTLKDQGWDQNNSTYSFTRDTTVTNENVFTLSLDIYAGNVGTGLAFKFLYKETADETDVPWARQVGMQHLEGIEGSDVDAVYKINGETVFTTAEDNGAFNNIALAKGQEGRYTFTLKTKSNTDNNPVISVKKESSITVDYDMYAIGDMNNFGATKIEMVENVVDGQATTWTCKLNVTAASLYRNADGIIADDEDGNAAGQYAAVCILNDRDGKTYAPVASEGVIVKEVKDFADKNTYTCILLKEGKYNVVFTENKTATEVGGSVTFTENAFEMYLIGTINNWNVATATTPDYAMTEQEDGSWTAKITVQKDEKIKSYNKLGLTDADKYSAGSDVTLTAGTWAVKYDPETNTIKVEKYGYYLVGTFMDGENKLNFAIKAGVTPAFEATETEGVYTVTYNFTDVSAQYDWMGAGNIAAVKAVWGTELNGVGDLDWYGEESGNGNFMITSTGAWTITLNLSNYRITGVKA